MRKAEPCRVGSRLSGISTTLCSRLHNYVNHYTFLAFPARPTTAPRSSFLLFINEITEALLESNVGMLFADQMNSLHVLRWRQNDAPSDAGSRQCIRPTCNSAGCLQVLREGLNDEQILLLCVAPLCGLMHFRTGSPVPNQFPMQETGRLSRPAKPPVCSEQIHRSPSRRLNCPMPTKRQIPRRS
jgi:hypothetical protein